MSLKTLFTRRIDPIDAVNEELGAAYRNSPEWQLTKLVTTGMVSDTFYVDAQTLNDQILALANAVSPGFLAKLVVYARNEGAMRANPIQLLVLLSVRDPALFRRVCRRVLLNAADVLDFATVVLSEQIRKEFGTAPREELRSLLNDLDPYQYIKHGSAKQNPSLRDLIRIMHPKPKDEATTHLFRWVLDKRAKDGTATWDEALLPEKVRAYLRFVALAGDASDTAVAERCRLLETGWLPHEVVTTHKLGTSEWTALAQHMPYMATLRNLNTMARQGVFEDERVVAAIAAKLGDEQAVLRSKQFPYRFLSAYLAAKESLPQPIKTALGRALEVATRNVPAFEGTVVVAPDVSGSMQGFVAGGSRVRHLDVAALVSAAVLRHNAGAKVVAFDTACHEQPLNADDTILTNAEKLAAFRGGGTAVSLPFQYVLNKGLAKKLGWLIAITDSESWFDPPHARGNQGTRAAELWREIRRKNPTARALLVNVAPYTTDQLPEGMAGVTMVSGFSDEVFRLMGLLAGGGIEGQLAAIEEVNLGTG